MKAAVRLRQAECYIQIECLPHAEVYQEHDDDVGPWCQCNSAVSTRWQH
jgi:hypothetical protein